MGLKTFTPDLEGKKYLGNDGTEYYIDNVMSEHSLRVGYWEGRLMLYIYIRVDLDDFNFWFKEWLDV